MKLALIVPYRDRAEQLKNFIPGIREYLDSYHIDFDLIVAQQMGRSLFNKGRLMNAAVRENMGYGYYIFHDVDLFPVRSSPHKEPEHFGYHGMPNYFPIDHARIIVKPAQKVAGCVFGVSAQVYSDVNGHSNSYWGWGYEDRDFYERLKHYGVPVEEQGKRGHRSYGQRFFKALDGGSGWVPGFERNEAVFHDIMRNRDEDFKRDGLNSVLYRLDTVHEFDTHRQLDIWI